MREWKRRNKEKVNAINLRVKAKNPELYRSINRVSIAKMRGIDPERFKVVARRSRKKHQNRRQEATKAWAKRVPGTYLFYNAKQRAKKLGLPFDLVRTDVVIPAICPVLGIPLDATVNGRRGFHPNSPSIDRIVPERGYVRGNIAVISNIANTLKRLETTPERLRLVADYIERETARVLRELG